MPYGTSSMTFCQFYFAFTCSWERRCSFIVLEIHASREIRRKMTHRIFLKTTSFLFRERIHRPKATNRQVTTEIRRKRYRNGNGRNVKHDFFQLTIYYEDNTTCSFQNTTQKLRLTLLILSMLNFYVLYSANVCRKSTRGAGTLEKDVRETLDRHHLSYGLTHFDILKEGSFKKVRSVLFWQCVQVSCLIFFRQHGIPTTLSTALFALRLPHVWFINVPWLPYDETFLAGAHGLCGTELPLALKRKVMLRRARQSIHVCATWLICMLLHVGMHDMLPDVEVSNVMGDCSSYWAVIVLYTYDHVFLCAECYRFLFN